jgi:hypothetical protein
MPIYNRLSKKLEINNIPKNPISKKNITKVNRTG